MGAHVCSMTPRVARAAAGGTYERIYAVVRRVPVGRVATYGQVARRARIVHGARQVGYALHALPEHTAVPWHRVVNARGAISLRGGGDATQRILLEREGVRFGAGGRIDLGAHGWQRTHDAPAARRTKGAHERTRTGR
jgi:methylated-DNA-protein-cysteine methyltransferase related protein